jgi:hypothetical protein
VRKVGVRRDLTPGALMMLSRAATVNLCPPAEDSLMIAQTGPGCKPSCLIPLAQLRKSGSTPRESAHDAGPRRKAALIDVCAWAIATGHLELIARSWLALESEVRYA